jgi:hypothetical protein
MEENKQSSSKKKRTRRKKCDEGNIDLLMYIGY